MVSLGLTDICKKFYFDVLNTEQLIMVSQDKVFKFNFATEILTEYYDYVSNLMAQPEYFIMDTF